MHKPAQGQAPARAAVVPAGRALVLAAVQQMLPDKVPVRAVAATAVPATPHWLRLTAWMAPATDRRQVVPTGLQVVRAPGRLARTTVLPAAGRVMVRRPGLVPMESGLEALPLMAVLQAQAEPGQAVMDRVVPVPAQMVPMLVSARLAPQAWPEAMQRLLVPVEMPGQALALQVRTAPVQPGPVGTLEQSPVVRAALVVRAVMAAVSMARAVPVVRAIRSRPWSGWWMRPVRACAWKRK
ncbi:MAG: hypothetical protein KIS79_08105 [Burkholderiales bacterium]|nr:hypothetical protein [Burkholderiales bacterium]